MRAIMIPLQITLPFTTHLNKCQAFKVRVPPHGAVQHVILGSCLPTCDIVYPNIKIVNLFFFFSPWIKSLGTKSMGYQSRSSCHMENATEIIIKSWHMNLYLHNNKFQYTWATQQGIKNVTILGFYFLKNKKNLYLSLGGNLGCLTWVRLKQPKEQHDPFLPMPAVLLCV